MFFYHKLYYFADVYYAHSHQRQLVGLTGVLRQSAIVTIKAVQTLLLTGVIPKAIKTKRCDGCSLFSRCLPGAVDKIGRYQEAK